MRFLAPLLTLLLLSGCPGSGRPCSSPEVLFPGVRATGSVTDGGLVAEVTWSPTSAPATFYASPRVVSTTMRLLDGGVTGAQLGQLQPLTVGSVDFTLEYPEGPTRCQHVGMDDTFVLSVSLPVPNDGGASTGTVTTSTELGAL